jgi:hypothetical protein
MEPNKLTPEQWLTLGVFLVVVFVASVLIAA